MPTTTRSKNRRSTILAKISIEESQIWENASPNPFQKKKSQKEKSSSKRKSTSQTCAVSKSTSQISQLTERSENLIDSLNKLRQSLDTSKIPEHLACRDEQFDQIFNFCYDGINSNSSGILYVAGVPGTGKTATMRKVLQKLNELSDENEIDDFEYFHVNGMTLAGDPKNIFTAIYKQMICDEHEDAKNLSSCFGNLDELGCEDGFGATKSEVGKSKTMATPKIGECKREVTKYFSTKSAKSSPVTLLFIDELDLLQTRTQDVLYTIFDWPARKNSKLLIVSIANTLDLPERLESTRLTSRIGHARVIFSPYSRKDLVKVVNSRFETLANEHFTENGEHFLNIFQQDAVKFIATKVTSVTGDARRALDACKLAVNYLVTDVEDFLGDEIKKIENDIVKETSENKENENPVRKSPRKKSVALIANARLDDNRDLINFPDKVTITHALRALNSLFGGGNSKEKCKTVIISSLPKVDKIILKIIVKTLKQSGADTVSVGEVYRLSKAHLNAEGIVSLEGHCLSNDAIDKSLRRMAGMDLIKTDNFSWKPLAKVTVEGRCDDVLYALEEEKC